MTRLNRFTKMLRKTFVVTMFGESFSWINEFVDHVQHLEKDGWYWQIYTPAKLESKGNVQIIDMDCEKFNNLVEKKLGVRPNFFITDKGVPSVHITDYYVASGVIFEDWLKDSDFWGITNLDVVYGNLRFYLPDEELQAVDVFTDDVNTINGVFCLFRNVTKCNYLFRKIPNWKEKFAQSPCPKCLGTGEKHTLFGTDEFDMTEVMKNELTDPTTTMRYSYPRYYPLHSHDRLENHLPNIKLKIQPNGSLWELLEDVNGPKWIHARPFIGRQVMYFHFQRTKSWPQCLK